MVFVERGIEALRRAQSNAPSKMVLSRSLAVGRNVRQAIREWDSTPRLRDPVQLSRASIVLTDLLLFRMAAIPFGYIDVCSSRPNQEPKASILLHHMSQFTLA